MGVLSCYHPDIIKFIECKSDPNNVNVFERFNLSVMVDDEFMKAVESDGDITLHYPVYTKDFEIERDPAKWTHSETMRARDLWDKIITRAYMSGEPGVLFYDNMNRDNNVRYCETIIGTNPCGEYLSGVITKIPEGCKVVTTDTVNLTGRGGEVVGTFTPPSETVDSTTFKGACNLGSLFLPAFLRGTQENCVDYRHDEWDDYFYVFDWDALAKAVETAVEMLNCVVDVNHFPHKDYENYQKNLRTIGLGITGLADVMALLDIRYGSWLSTQFASVLMNYIAANAYLTSQKLAEKDGSFPLFVSEEFQKSGYLQRRITISEENALYTSEDAVCSLLGLDDIASKTKEIWVSYLTNLKNGAGMRNARLLSVAPTGTLSLVFGNNCSSGLEPIYQLESTRRIKMHGQSDDDVVEVALEDPAWKQFKDIESTIWVDKDVFVAVDDTRATDRKITVDEHVQVLAAIAQNVDMSCSKTINIPTDYSFEDTKEVYMKCWKLGVKGCTIFRPNEFREGIFVTSKKTDKPAETASKPSGSPSTELKRGDIIQVGNDVIGRERHLQTGCGTLHLQAYFDPATGKLLEVYASKGSTGGCNSFMTEVSRLISLAARGGVDTSELVDQLKSAPPCVSYCVAAKTGCNVSPGTSCPAAIGYALEDMQQEINMTLIWDDDVDEEVWEPTRKCEKNTVVTVPVKSTVVTVPTNKSTCPDCGAEIIVEGGCNICKSCGWSKCG